MKSTDPADETLETRDPAKRTRDPTQLLRASKNRFIGISVSQPWLSLPTVMRRSITALTGKAVHEASLGSVLPTGVSTMLVVGRRTAQCAR